jgi:hypothetical protein
LSQQTDNLVNESITLGGSSARLMVGGLVVGVAGVLAAVGLSKAVHGDLTRFLFSYLFAWATFLAIALGGMFFVLIQHLTAAGWSVGVRRVAESITATIPLLGILSLPLLGSVLANNGQLYCWAQPTDQTAGKVAVEAHADAAAEFLHRGTDELTLKKRAWLNPTFFTARVVGYFVIWSAIAVLLWRQSVLQDHTGDAAITVRLRGLAAPAMVLYGLTVTFAAFDLLMSLDPHWYSTIFGVYYFSGAVVAFLAALIVACVVLQKSGRLGSTISIEHYHDLGKYLLGFVFFWGYIAFSQFMLLWYASLPETVPWLARRGASSSTADFAHMGYGINSWTRLSLALLFGNLLIPFAGLLSRHAKRNRSALFFWALWLLVFHVLDIYWIVMPEMVPGDPRQFRVSPVDFAAFFGVGGLCLAGWLWIARRAPLVPLADPRLQDSLTFQNV